MNTIKQTTNKLGYIGNTVNRDAWSTPSKYIESARKVMGTIDFDPFSNHDANKTVKATKYLTEEDDAFNTIWDNGNLWVNPPYGKGICEQSCMEFLTWWEGKWTAHMDGEDCAAVVLTNNATDTKWWQALANEASAVCFPNHRISFVSHDNKNVSGNTRGQTFFYYGNDVAAFKAEFEQYGKCV
jgi:phage N-6-adenine-methyltransferase